MACDIELHLTSEHTQSAIELLHAHCDLSKTRIKTVMQCGAVWFTRGQQTKRLRRATAELLAGDIVHMYYDAETIDTPPPPALLMADEGGYSVWCKPAGMFTQGTKWGDHHTICRWAEQHLEPQREVKIVHRLDRHTSGLIMLAHTKQAAAELSRLFREREITKHYHAVVEGDFAAVGVKQRIDAPIDDKHAISDVTVLGLADNRSLLNVHIGTGRKHQIRRHLSEAGFPIVGDKMYGLVDELGLQLCAIELSFVCPLTGQPRLYQTPESWRPHLAT